MAENYFGITDTGKLRDNNEDTFIAEKVLNNGFVAACVIDGVGGYEGGEVAAAIARQSILDYFTVPSGDVITMMREALRAANEKIYSEKLQSKINKDMACVLTLAMVNTKNNKFYYAHVGDTRLYLLRDNTLVKVTKDHSFVGFLEDSGRLSEEAAMTHPKRNEINKALGFDMQLGKQEDYIETGESPFLPGDLLLLCSDGLTDMIGSAEITTILTSNKLLQEKGEDLIAAANKAGGKDNITVVLVQNDKKPVKQKATKPAAIEKKKYQQEKGADQSEQPGELRQIPSQQRNNNKIIIFSLSVLCTLLIIGFLWLLLKKPKQETMATAPINNEQDTLITKQNLQEEKLRDTLNKLHGKTLLLHDSLFKQPVILSDTLFIKKDSFSLQGKDNVAFTKDSTFTGAAIVLSPDCKYVLLDNITLENFDIGILVPANPKALHLKNVRFINCKIPVQYQFSFPNNQYINGSLGDKAFFKADSLPKTK